MIGTEPQFDHEHYEKLCALSTAGVLTPAESGELSSHLDCCAECKDAFAQYRDIASGGMAYLAENFAARPGTRSGAEAFDEDAALARLMETTQPSRRQIVPTPVSAAKDEKKSANRSRGLPGGQTRVLARGLIAASILALVASISFRIGGLRSKPEPAPAAKAALNAAMEQIAAEKQTLAATAQADSRRLAELEQQLAARKDEAEQYRAQAKAAADGLTAATVSIGTARSQAEARIAELAQERDAAIARLHEAESLYRTVQDELNNVRSQHQQDLLRMASLETRIDGLSADLKDQNARAKSDEQYLSSDKDIRDLIGARNLYIADIMDVDESGKSRRPFGRVFYTKTKSLIFYAYDLDRQPGVRQTSTFQVWGRTGSRQGNPLSLGILYMDSETNRRWTLRVDNAQQLAQLDAVFVTAEPSAQIGKPTGKPFLYASLRRDANHP